MSKYTVSRILDPFSGQTVVLGTASPKRSASDRKNRGETSRGGADADGRVEIRSKRRTGKDDPA
jgi:hypothetical protein